MVEIKNLYNSILVRGRRSAPTYDQVRREARLLDESRNAADLYRL